jgi:hypothetical protein
VPFAAATGVAAVSLALMFLAARDGWLGPDVGRGDGFCEAARAGWLKQPANALSNIGFVAAGLAVGWRARLPRGRLAGTGLATSYAVVVVLLGPGSMAMHATQTELGGRLDQLSMYLVAAFAAAYAWVRTVDRGTGFFLGSFVGLVVLCEAVEQLGSGIPVVDNAGNAVFGLVLVTAIVLEVRLRRSAPSPLDVRWIRGAVGAMVLAFAIWNLAKDGTPLCHPGSLLQGHAAWHLLCAVAAWCLYRYWASTAGGPPVPALAPVVSDEAPVAVTTDPAWDT